MGTETLSWWAEHLPSEEVRGLLVKAAENHPHGFTDTRSIGCNWAKVLSRQGYNALPPYARNELAHEYLRRTERVQRVPVS